MKLGKFIKEIREQQGLIQEDLARMTGVDNSYISKIENGQLPSLVYCYRLAKALNMEYSEMERSYYEDKTELARKHALETSKIDVPFRSYEEIDALAVKDRSYFLAPLERRYLDLPGDRGHIVQRLTGLQFIENELLFGANSSLIYGGLFVGDCTYLGKENAIVIATKEVKGKRKGEVSEETKTFHTLHEIGHYKLHVLGQVYRQAVPQPPETPRYCSSGDRSRMELQANRYAVAFLMPEEDIRYILADKRSFNLQQDGGRLCKYFSVEPWMLKFRLSKLGIRVF